MNIEKALHQVFETVPYVLYGYSGIDYSRFYPEYRSALVFAVPYGKQLTLETYTEEEFEQGIREAKSRIEKLLERIEIVLKKNNIKYYVPPIAQESEETLIAPFSFKFAAVNSGIGWIGRNDVVITQKYGPRIRLSAVLIDMEFEYAEKITRSYCPDECDLCVKICPYGALTGIKWDPDKLRSDIIDYHLCNEKRSLFIKKSGRKSSCGLCMAVCPYGVKNEK